MPGLTDFLLLLRNQLVFFQSRPSGADRTRFSAPALRFHSYCQHRWLSPQLAVGQSAQTTSVMAKADKKNKELLARQKSLEVRWPYVLSRHTSA